MQSKHIFSAACLACAVAGASGSASAQEHRVSETSDGYAVEFSDGDLLGQTLSLTGYIVPLRSTTPRVLLIRPRTSFVPELQKSIEAF